MGRGIKHKWEPPFRVVPISSLLNCFSRGVRLRLCGWSHFHLLRAFAFCRFSFQPIAFGFCLLQHHLPAVPWIFLSVDLPGRSVLQNAVWSISFDQYFCCTEHFRPFSFPVPRNCRRNLRLFFFPGF